MRIAALFVKLGNTTYLSPVSRLGLFNKLSPPNSTVAY